MQNESPKPEAADLPGYDEAHAAAENDLHLFGAGFLMRTSTGWERLHPGSVSIDRTKSKVPEKHDG